MFKNLTCILLILLNSLAIASDTEGHTMLKDQQDVLNTIENMTRAFHEGDIDGVMLSYEANPTISFEPTKPISDPAILRQMFQGAFQMKPQFSYSGHEVLIANDIALHLSPWSMKGKAPDGSEVEQSGLSIAVLRRQEDGTWKMVIDNPHGQNLLNQ